jgi:hypothetical protein
MAGAQVLLDPPTLAGELGITTGTLAKWRHRRFGPAWVLVGNRVRYRRDDLDAWLAERRRESTAKVPADAN